MTWTSTDNEKAMIQGWLIALNMDTNKFQIQSYGEADKFESDEEAFQYVHSMAGESNLHYRALQRIGYFEEAPPIGLTPKSIWLKLRLKDIKEAAKRYESIGKEIPKEWLEEAGELALKLEDWV